MSEQERVLKIDKIESLKKDAKSVGREAFWDALVAGYLSVITIAGGVKLVSSDSSFINYVIIGLIAAYCGHRIKTTNDLLLKKNRLELRAELLEDEIEIDDKLNGKRIF